MTSAVAPLKPGNTKPLKRIFATTNEMHRVPKFERTGRNPAHDTGDSIYLYTPEARRKLRAIASACTYKIVDRIRS